MLWIMKHTPLLKEYLPITELSQQRYAWIYAEIRSKQLKPQATTGPHLTNRDIRTKYTVTVRNKFDTLQEISETLTLNNKYENFISVKIKAATAECILTKPRAKWRVPWKSQVVRKKWDDMKIVSLLNRNPTNANVQKLKKPQRELTHNKMKN